MQNNEKISRLAEIIKNSGKTVFFGGAGVSTESGIPDFRSVDGLYNTQYDYPPETILSHSFFVRNTDEFFRFYRNKMIYEDAKPNFAHKTLAALEKIGKISAVITQNIDGLHEMAGSKNVFNLHGSIYKNTCQRCGATFGINSIKSSKGVPKCDCGGIIKPDVVLYEEALDERTVNGAIRAISQADTLIVGGTSLTVYPAASFLNFFEGRHLILVNKTATFADKNAEMVIPVPIGEVFEQVARILNLTV